MGKTHICLEPQALEKKIRDTYQVWKNPVITSHIIIQIRNHTSMNVFLCSVYSVSNMSHALFTQLNSKSKLLCHQK